MSELKPRPKSSPGRRILNPRDRFQQLAEIVADFVEASNHPHSVFHDMPNDGVSVEYRGKKQKEDPLICRMRSRRNYYRDRPHILAREHAKYHATKGAKTKAARAQAIANARCNECGKPCPPRGNVGPVPQWCGATCYDRAKYRRKKEAK